MVLRIEKSLDFHVAVSAKYERSCYGMSLQELVHTTKPVATTLLPADRAAAAAAAAEAAAAAGGGGVDVDSFSGGRATAADSANGGGKLSIPKELWRLVDALWAGNALKEKDLFNSKADPKEVRITIMGLYGLSWIYFFLSLRRCSAFHNSSNYIVLLLHISPFTHR